MKLNIYFCIIFLILLLGCTSKIENRFICQNGNTVTDPSQCNSQNNQVARVTQNQTNQAIAQPIQQQITSFCGDGKCDNGETNNCCSDCGCGTGFSCNQSTNLCEKKQASLAVDAQVNPRISSTALYSLSRQMLDSLQQPFSTIILKNNGDLMLNNITVSVSISPYTDVYTQNVGSLNPNQTISVNITPQANSTILNILENKDVSVQFKVTYVDELGVAGSNEFTKITTLTGRNDFTWYPVNYVASWVQPRNETVRAFATEATPGSATFANDTQKLKAAKEIFEQLSAYGVKYNTDALGGADYLQFPEETLYYRNGDCDDQAILLASLLESVGIPVKLILVPSHIFLYIQGDNSIYPIEPTMVGTGATFEQAQQVGTQNYNDYLNKGQIQEVVDVDQSFFQGIRSADFKYENPVPLPKISVSVSSKEINWNFADGWVEKVGVQFTNNGNATGRRCAILNLIDYPGNTLTSTERCKIVGANQTVSETVNFNITCGLSCSDPSPEPKVIVTG